MSSSINKFEEAEAEWDNVAEIEAKFKSNNVDVERIGGPTLPKHPLATPLITIREVLEHVEGDWMEPYIDQVNLHQTTGKSLASRFLPCLPWISPPLSPQHLRDVKRVMATALVSLNNDDSTHIRILCTLYRQLTVTRLDPPRYGGHWEDIGFQGTDPATDLRGVGILGLIQALHLVMTPELLPMARSVHNLSRNPSQEFPFLVLAINISRICLHALRDGLLDRLITEEESVWSVVNSFYAGIVYYVFLRWKTEHLTITNSGFVLQDAEKTARSSPVIIIRKLERSLVTDYSVETKQAAREQVERDLRCVSANEHF